MAVKKGDQKRLECTEHEIPVLLADNKNGRRGGQHDAPNDGHHEGPSLGYEFPDRVCVSLFHQRWDRGVRQ
jgi:hypothetical protein